MLNDITITDEATLWREKADRLQSQLHTMIGRLEFMRHREIGSRDMIDMMTDANVRKDRQIRAMQRRFKVVLAKERKEAERRECISAVACFVAGFLSAGVILLVYFWKRAGML